MSGSPPEDAQLVAASSGDGPARLWLERVALGLAIVWITALLVAFALRVNHPLELEWMEGGVLLQARRMLASEPVYGPPSAEYVPFLYTPGYGVVVAGLGLVFPLSLTLARLVSIAATLATAVGIGVIVRDEVTFSGVAPRRAPTASWLAVGLYASSYVFTYRWMDVARGDSLMLALLVWGAWSLRWSDRGRGRAVLAGCLLAAAFWTKQTAFVVIAGLGLGALTLLPWSSLFVTGSILAITCVGGVALVDARTQGWFWRWIYEAHQAHPFNAERFWWKSAWMVVHAAPFATALSIGVVIEALRTRQPRIGVASYWTCALVAAALASALGYSTLWAESNAFLPLAAFGATWVGVAISGSAASVSTVSREQVTYVRAWHSALVGGQLAYALVFEPNAFPIQQRGLQGLPSSLLLQDPWRTIPTATDRAQAAAFAQRLSMLPGPALALSRPWWSVLSGGDGHVGTMGLNDVTPVERARLERELAAQVRAGAWPVVITEGEPPRWLGGLLSRQYVLDVELRGKTRVRPMTGWMSAAGMPVPWRGVQRVWFRVDGRQGGSAPPRAEDVYPAAP